MTKYTQRALQQYRSGSAPYREEELNSERKRKVFRFIYYPTIDLGIFIMVLISIVILIIELTHPNPNHVGSWMGSLVGKEANPTLLNIDILLTVIFGIEYILKFWLSPKKGKYFISNIVELIALFPVLRVFRMVRILRVLRLYRLVRLNQIIDNSVLKQNEETSDMVTVLMYLIFSIIFGTVGIMIFERGHNDGFLHITDGLWWCIVTITTVGYGDISPITPMGKLVAVCIMFIGLAFYASLTGVISEALIKRARAQKKERMEENMFSKHIIICGWNKHAPTICTQILEDENQLILTIAPYAINNFSHPRFFFKELDVTKQNALTNAKIKHASCLILLSETNLPTGSDSDARNLLIIMNAHAVRKNIPIILEVQNQETEEHARMMGVHKIYHLSKMAGSMLKNLVQEQTSISLIKKSSDRLECPTEFIGKSFEVLHLHFTQNQRQMIIGIRRDQQDTVPCPFEEILFEGDQLILLN